MLRSLIMLLMCFSMTFSVPARSELDQSLNSFDEPYIVGDWVWRAPKGKPILLGEFSYRMMTIRFDSKNDFLFVLQRDNGKPDVWQGRYDITSEFLTLYPQGDKPQIMQFQLSQNQFVMGNVVFSKLPPAELLGIWRSVEITGSDVTSHLQSFAVQFLPDFQFETQSVGKDGKLLTNRGLYIYENNEIVLLYANGRQSLRIAQKNNELILKDILFDSHIALVKR